MWNAAFDPPCLHKAPGPVHDVSTLARVNHSVSTVTINSVPFLFPVTASIHHGAHVHGLAAVLARDCVFIIP